jgi:phosphoadenosine phosphosulfate reductase
LLNKTDPTQCCFLRKVVPLRRTLANYDAWVTGVRRVDAPTRAGTPVVQWDERNGLVKVNPIAAWSDAEFTDYITANGILENPLVGEGYLSIGCAPCTAKPLPGADPRSGRWAGQAKTECGLHG